MTPLMKAAIHLGQDSWRIQKSARTPNWRTFFKKEHSECKALDDHSPHGQDLHCSTTT